MKNTYKILVSLTLLFVIYSFSYNEKSSLKKFYGKWHIVKVKYNSDTLSNGEKIHELIIQYLENGYFNSVEINKKLITLIGEKKENTKIFKYNSEDTYTHQDTTFIESMKIIEITPNERIKLITGAFNFTLVK